MVLIPVKLKQQSLEEGNEVVTICHGLKLEAPDGKQKLTDCANMEGMQCGYSEE